MMADWGYTVSTENSFGSLGNDEMAREQFQTMNKRKRNNTEQSGDRINMFMQGSPDDKLCFIYDELCSIKGMQEQMNRGMLDFRKEFRYVNEKLGQVIQVTNKNTNMLKTLAYKSIDQEARSRRNNLVFWGISENYGENCFQIIRDFIRQHLDLDAGKMYLARAHRLGPRKVGSRNPHRPIIVNFRDFCDTDMVMNRAHMLKNSPFSVGYDLPKEINEARKRLWDELKSIKTTNPRARFQILYPAKLIVEGRLVRDEFPDRIEIIQGSRLGDFSHINNNFSFDQPNGHLTGPVSTNNSVAQLNTRGQACDNLCINTVVRNTMNEHSIVSARDNFTIPSTGLVNMEHSQTYSDCDTAQKSLEKSFEQNVDEHTSQSDQNNEGCKKGSVDSTYLKTKEKSVSSVASDSQAQGHSVQNDTACSLFRPFSPSDPNINKSNTCKNNNSERISRTMARGERRAQSTSLPRANTLSRESRENSGVKNRQTNKNSSADKNNSSRNNSGSGIPAQAGSCDKNMNEPCDNDRQTADMQTA